MIAWVALATAVPGEILWTDPDRRVIHETPVGDDILGGILERDDTASDALYFKFRVDPLSDAANERYYAAFQLAEKGENRLAVGNAPEAWGYSAFNTAEIGPENKEAGEFNLSSAHPEAAALGATKPYELPVINDSRTIVFKVQYVPGGDDLVTVWLEPHLRRGATDENQPALLTTKFKADASFDEIRLRFAANHDKGGNGWIFSEMAIATSFQDFVQVQFWERWWFITGSVLLMLAAVAAAIRLAERRKYLVRLRALEQQRVVDLERARIAEDLHDDLGSSLARITLLTDLLRQDRDDPEQVDAHARRLAESADETVRSFEEIVWAVRPGSDTLQSLVHYLAHVATELYEDGPARCRLDLPHDLPERPLPPDFRHNVFLIVKEALTNALRHSHSEEVRLRMRADDRRVQIDVEDDGQGFDPRAEAPPGTHNGLGNMRRRAASLGGTLEVESAAGQGTVVRLHAPFPKTRVDGA